MVTGRELPDLHAFAPRLDLFDRVVVENGALLYTPATQGRAAARTAAAAAFVTRLQDARHPAAFGRAGIVATWEPNETAVLDAIRDLGLDLQIIFNKGAVMVLPNGINKASGLAAALEDLGLSAHNVVATGDAENDLAFMRTCGCAVAVGNALPAVKEAADLVTRGDAGRRRGESIEPGSTTSTAARGRDRRHSVPIGVTGSTTSARSARPDRGSVLITGTSGAASPRSRPRSLERLAAADFQLCLFDPEGDYGNFNEAVTFGDADTPVAPDTVLDAVRKLGTNVTVNLLGLARRGSARTCWRACCRPCSTSAPNMAGRTGSSSTKRITCCRVGGMPAPASTSTRRSRPSSSPCIRTRWRPVRSSHRHRAAHRPARASG